MNLEKTFIQACLDGESRETEIDKYVGYYRTTMHLKMGGQGWNVKN